VIYRPEPEFAVILITTLGNNINAATGNSNTADYLGRRLYQVKA